MERFILWECELFGRKEDVVLFLGRFRELRVKEKEEFVKRVLSEYGVNSEQFYFVVQGFVVYVMMRHGVYWDEDVFQEAFLSVMEKVKYWDEGKGNLLSFLYSLIRDRVSQKKYWDSVARVRGVEESRVYEDDVDEKWEEWYEESKLEDYFLLKEVAGMVVRGLRGEVLESVLRGEDSVYRRAIMWHVVRGIDAMV